jgi:hypothetical protein
MGKSHALPAIVSAFAIFVLVHVAGAIEDPQTLLQGALVKVVIVVVFVKGMRAALAVERPANG